MKLPGSPRTLPGRSQEPQETPGRLPGTQEAPGRTRKPKEAPGPGLDSRLDFSSPKGIGTQLKTKDSPNPTVVQLQQPRKVLEIN